jgi:hypothetical protein
MSDKLWIIGKNIHLNIAEKEWMGVMQRQFMCTEQEALAEIAEYKREQAFMYQQQGNLALTRHILQELDEWDDEREAEFKELQEAIEEIKLILPNSRS